MNFYQKISKFSQNFPTICVFPPNARKINAWFVNFFEKHAKIHFSQIFTIHLLTPWASERAHLCHCATLSTHVASCPCNSLIGNASVRFSQSLSAQTPAPAFDVNKRITNSFLVLIYFPHLLYDSQSLAGEIDLIKMAPQGFCCYFSSSPPL